MYETEQKPDRTLIVAVVTKGTNRVATDENLAELKLLCQTAGCEVVLQMTQELSKISNATCVGSGKVAEIIDLIKERDLQLVVFDDELTPMQSRNLTRELNIKVMDRSGIIIEIFANHAKTQESKTQVELAHLQYMLPRLTRLWSHLSKQYGGVGTNAKGPGEKQLETDKRLLRERIQFLKGKLDGIDVQMQTQRKGRKELTRFALVGYTNAGKSTLMKQLSAADVYVEDKLFATLDTTVRAIELPNGEKALLSDTVGFIHKLPSNLVASFRSTLSEAREADFLVNVIDVSHPNFQKHIDVVDETLLSIGAVDKPVIHIFNKIDLLKDRNNIDELKREYSHPLFISAKHGTNIESILEKFIELSAAKSKKISLFLPYSKMQMINKIYDNAEVIDRTETENGIALKLRIKKDYSELFHNLYKEFLTN